MTQHLLAKKVAKKTAKKSDEAEESAGGGSDNTAAERSRKRRQPILEGLDRGLAQVQKEDWAGASKTLRALLDGHQTDADILDRVRVYLAVCERKLVGAGAPVKTSDDHYHGGILRLNNGDFDGAREAFEKALRLDASSDKAHYAMAITLSQAERLGEAVSHLRKAIEINPENRVFARNDADLTPLRDEVEVAELLGGI